MVKIEFHPFLLRVFLFLFVMYLRVLLQSLVFVH